MCDYSLIIPVYNNGEFLQNIEEYLTLEENVEKRFEVILVDDGSTDASLMICREIAKRKSFVKVWTQKHAGISAARNTGLMHASGKIILFADCDDIVDCNGLLSFLNQFQKEDLCVFSFWQGNDAKWESARDLQDEVFYINTLSENFLEKHYKKLAGSVWNKAYKRELITKYQLQFVSEKEIGNEDILFNLMYLCHCRNVRFSSQRYYYYRIWGGSASHRKEKGTDIIRRFCAGASLFHTYALQKKIDLKEFSYYFLIKQFLLAQRSCLDSTQKKAADTAKIFLNNPVIVEICMQAKKGGQSFWKKQEHLTESRYYKILQVRNEVMLGNQEALVKAIECVLIDCE